MFYYYAYKLLALSSFLYHSSSPAADKQIFMFCILIKFSVKTTFLQRITHYKVHVFPNWTIVHFTRFLNVFAWFYVLYCNLIYRSLIRPFWYTLMTITLNGKVQKKVDGEKSYLWLVKPFTESWHGLFNHLLSYYTVKVYHWGGQQDSSSREQVHFLQRNLFYNTNRNNQSEKKLIK